MKAKIKIDWVGFVSNMLAVILGIVITFGVQAIIDGKNQKREIASALQLVHDELAESLSSLQQCAQILDNESVSAQFFLTNRNRLADFPTDSIQYHSAVVLMLPMLTMPNDALELLKTSSLFPKIGDNDLAMQIIRAYDQCNMLCEIFNQTESNKADYLRRATSGKALEHLVERGILSMTDVVTSEDGMYILNTMLRSPAPTINAGIPDIEKAISMIGDYLCD